MEVEEVEVVVEEEAIAKLKATIVELLARIDGSDTMKKTMVYDSSSM